MTSTFTLRGRRGTWRHGRAFCVAGVVLIGLGWLWWRAWVPVGAVDAAPVCVAGVALRDIDRDFAWQAWHLATWTCILRGRRGTYRTGLALVERLDGAMDAAPVCVAGVALGDIDRHFAWQAWHLATWTCILRGGRGTWWHRPSLCVAGVALGDIDLHFAWQAWRLCHWAGSSGACCRRAKTQWQSRTDRARDRQPILPNVAVWTA